MTGPEHYEASERLLAEGERCMKHMTVQEFASIVCAAEAHATLALAAATAEARGLHWDEVLT
jgi:hypothetical protein